MRLRRHDERKGSAFPKETKKHWRLRLQLGRHSLGIIWGGDGEPEAHRSSWRQSRISVPACADPIRSPKKPLAPRSASTSCEYRRFFDKTDRIAKRIECIKRALAPRTLNDLAGRIVVDVFGREALELTRVCMHRLKIAYRKINVVRIRTGLFVVS